MGLFQKQQYSLLKQRSAAPAGFGSFVLIDTAISGRAAAEIVTALEAEKADYHLLLLLDSMGERLQGPYKRVIEASQHVTQIPVPSLYTEDRGAAMMGITTALFPDLTSNDFVMSIWLELPHPKPWWVDGVPRPRLSTASQFYGYLNAMHFYASKVCLMKEFDDDCAAVEWFRLTLLDNLDLVEADATKAAINFPREWGEVEVTSSMALRLRR